MFRNFEEVSQASRKRYATLRIRLQLYWFANTTPNQGRRHGIRPRDGPVLNKC